MCQQSLPIHPDAPIHFTPIMAARPRTMRLLYSKVHYCTLQCTHDFSHTPFTRVHVHALTSLSPSRATFRSPQPLKSADALLHSDCTPPRRMLLAPTRGVGATSTRGVGATSDTCFAFLHVKFTTPPPQPTSLFSVPLVYCRLPSKPISQPACLQLPQ